MMGRGFYAFVVVGKKGKKISDLFLSHNKAAYFLFNHFKNGMHIDRMYCVKAPPRTRKIKPHGA